MSPSRRLESLEDLVQQLTEAYRNAHVDLASRLERDLIMNALRYRRSRVDTLDLKIINRAMAEFRYAARVFKPYRGRRKVSIFGSSRTPLGEPYYELAIEFARLMAQSGFMVITGGAEGIMKAGNVGAGAADSFGANIMLPAEQASNEVIADDPKLITFRYFFTRKLFFVMEAHAIALFPGGFGTHDEGFEVLTLLQTGKAPPMPLVLMELPGEDYWESWDWFIRTQMLQRGLISSDDLSLYRIVHSSAEGHDWILSYYSIYHSQRQVGDKLVIRLERELADNRLAQLNREFGDLVASGSMEKTAPLPAEADEAELNTKPRVMFTYNRQSPARLHQLILAINEVGSG